MLGLLLVQAVATSAAEGNITLGLGVAQEVGNQTHMLRTVVYAAESAVASVNNDPGSFPFVLTRPLALSTIDTGCDKITAVDKVLAAGLLTGTSCSTLQSVQTNESAASTATKMAGFLGPTCSGACQAVAILNELYQIPQVHSC